MDTVVAMRHENVPRRPPALRESLTKDPAWPWSLSLISVETTLSSWWLNAAGRPRQAHWWQTQDSSDEWTWLKDFLMVLLNLFYASQTCRGLHAGMGCLLLSSLSSTLRVTLASQSETLPVVFRSFSIVRPTEISSSEIFAHLTLSDGEF